MVAHVDSTNSNAQIDGRFQFTGPEQIFFQSRFRAEDAVASFNYNSFYAQAPDPAGSFGLSFKPIIILPVPFSPSLNGYWNPDPLYGQNDFAISVPVEYTYNNNNNFVPDGPQLGSSSVPRIIVVTDQFNPVNFTAELELVAGANFVMASLLSLVFTVLIYLF